MKYDIITYSLILYIKREIIAMFSTKLIINEFNDKKKKRHMGFRSNYDEPTTAHS